MKFLIFGGVNGLILGICGIYALEHWQFWVLSVWVFTCYEIGKRGYLD